MAYPVGAVERAMKVQEVILRALSGQLHLGPQCGTEPNRGISELRVLQLRVRSSCSATSPRTENVRKPARCYSRRGLNAAMVG